jgi:lysophospholipase L1-like esterase
MLESEQSESNLKILAFGDSLTEGFYFGGYRFHPYATELERLIDKHYADSAVAREALIHQLGMSGEFTSHMIPRLHEILSKNSSSPYDLVCILGGTNDLARTESGEEIFHRIEQLYQMTLSHGKNHLTKLACISIPQSACSDPEYVERRNYINERIRFFCRSNGPRAMLVDFEQVIPFEVNQREILKPLWDDSIHMTPDGYDELGRLIFSCIKDTL